MVEVLAPLRGDARTVGVRLGRRLAEAGPTDDVRCTIAGGETTVTVAGDGTGGRNQELALAAAPQLLGLPLALLAAFATDGEDAPPMPRARSRPERRWPRAIEAARDPNEHLSRNNAYPLFAALDDLIQTGPTGTNVCDLV